jgi:hypothetical protein
MAQAAVLLPVRLETRFDEPPGYAGARLRVLVVPDGCWLDRQQPASGTELDLLARVVAAAGGPLVTGAPSTPEAAAAFDALAGQVGPGRALWLARTFPAVQVDGAWAVDRSAAEPRKGGARGTRVHGLPSRLQLFALVGADDVSEDHPPVALGESAPKPSFTITPSGDVDDGWWPSWDSLTEVGLTFSVDLGADPAHPIAPDEIAVLYVVGLGEVDAADLVRPHLNAGDLGVLQPGSRTNTIAGTPAADLGQDAAAWRALGERDANGQDQLVSRALTGDYERLGPLVGSTDLLADQTCEALILTLWPALWGHAVSEVWGVHAPIVAGAGEAWPEAFLRPDGPLPSLRLGNQPYGLWPVSDWATWEDDEAAEEPLDGQPDLSVALRVRDATAERARSGVGTVAGADAARLWELLAQTPTSDGYELRAALHLEELLGFLGGAELDAARDWWKETIAATGLNLGGLESPIVTLGGPTPLSLGLVVPEIAFDASHRPLFLPEPDAHVSQAAKWLGQAPELWVADAFRWFQKMFRGNGLDPDMWGRLEKWLEQWPASLLWRLTVVSGLVALDRAARATNPDYIATNPLAQRIAGGFPTGATGPEVTVYKQFREGLVRMIKLTEDTGGDEKHPPLSILHALDRGGRGLLDTASHRVDPWLTGMAWRRLVSLDGSRPVGLYGWVDRPLTGKPGPDTEIGVLLAPSDAQARTAIVLRDKSRSDPDDVWHLDLNSVSVRDAVRLADDVRAGSHPSEALGREVERLIQQRVKIDNLRTKFPVRTEHAGRRTCDGIQVLAAATATPPDARLAGSGLDAADIASIQALAVTVDAYADLLVAEAVHEALGGRAEAAGHTMEAAAGLGVPPDLDVLATPRSGRALRTTVFVALPAAATPAATERSPAVIASPAVAAWLEAASGIAGGPSWTWHVQVAGADTPVTLAQIGLEPADALVVQPPVLDRMATAAAGGDPATTVAPSGPEVVRRLAATFAVSPVTGAHLGDGPAEAAAHDTAARTELLRRLAALQAAAGALVARLQAAATDAERAAALVDAARWGLLPDPARPEGEAAAAAADLSERVARVPAVAPDTDVAQLARLVEELVAPSAPIPILLDVAMAELESAVGALSPEPPDGHGRPRLDGTWLELVAAVRPPLARLEAHQALASAAGAGALSAATNHPGDPWLMAVPVPAPSDLLVPHLVVVYGPGALPAAGSTALGVLDGWAEVVPAERHTAGSAFRFNAPGACAPQAFLLAVTPVLGTDLTAEVVLATVEQARISAQARMARAEDLGNLDVLTAGVLPAFEQGGFQYAVPATWSDWP